MGHAINYYSVAKRSEIMKIAEQHAMHCILFCQLTLSATAEKKRRL